MRRQPANVTRQTRRQPIAESRGARTSRPKVLQPPIGGWNARDALDEMPDGDAVSLVNWFPRQSDCVTRPGFAVQCDTGEIGKTIKTIVQYGFGAISKMLACVNGKIFDVSTATPASLAVGLLSDDYVSDVLGGKMFLCNGLDTVKVYDGATIANSTFTGVTLANLNFVEVYKSRVFFIEKNTQKMWYGGIGSVTGALTSFDFSTVGSFGGNLKLLARLKGDGGDGGNDDIFLAIFEHGDVVAYTGSNPGDLNFWALLGQYKIGRPLSRFGIHTGDDDVYVITSRGYEKLTEIIKYGSSAPERLVMSSKIQKAVQEDINFLGATDDWKTMLFPGGQMFIVTVPRISSGRNYHVRNINTKAWCQFKDFYAFSWSMFGLKAYFGSNDGKVYEFSSSYTNDAGAAIVADGQLAWSYLGFPGYQKIVDLVKVVLKGSTRPPTMISLAADYGSLPITAYETGAAGTFYYWDTAVWDQSYWFGTDNAYQQWFNRNAVGDVIGIRVRITSSTTDVRWNSFTVLFTLGGLL